MEVFVVAPGLRSSTCAFPPGSAVGDLLDRFVSQQDFYVTSNGRLSHQEDPLQNGAVYHLEPRLCGGKGGFGSMLRALGAQIEKTTNREACRDLSGRRLRDVNHEKEMAEWLKKQAEREAEKEQRRMERLQRKLAEPKHQFTDPEYQQQCHDLSERLEDSVLKGLQVSSSSQVKADDVSAAKRPSSDQNQEVPQKKKKKKKKEEEEKKKKKTAGFWSGLDGLEELLSSEEEEEEAPPTSCRGAAAVTMTTRREEAESEPGSSSSSAGPNIRTPEDQRPGPSGDQRPPEPSKPSEPSAPAGQLDPSSVASAQQLDPSSVDLSSVASAQQLESLGLDALKEELASRGLKCGGTVSERAARLFSVRGLSPDRIDPAMLAKPKAKKKK
ncbi:splicing regulator SDE2 isoform 2-T2 [Odontesthes bonariensis]|uniref:splicing regulator SDE2 isoform X2 n=1 Tax=Odontesthes bonariensis TaxID=219752 RepID=UPI003F58BF7D